MRIEKRTGGDERRILTACITDPTVLARVAARWPPQGGLFASPWANAVAGLCVRHHARYGRPPGPAVEGLYEAWAARDGRDKATVELVGKFLAGLSDEYETLREEVNADYTIDLAGRHFNKVRLQRIKEELEEDLDNDNIEAAEQRLVAAPPIELGGGEGVDLMSDREAWEAAFAEPGTPLITYPGALGEFFGDTLQRDCFFSFEGPEKRGKTFFLLDIAWRAMEQRRRVAFFEVGDLSKNQIILRWAARAAGRPVRPGKVIVPKELVLDADGKLQVNFRSKVFDNRMTWPEAWRAVRKTVKHKIRSKDSYFRLSVHPNDSITVDGIRAVVDGWARNGWVPDVIVIDYADILAAPPGARDEREAINATWKGLKRLSQEMHNLVVTATQTDAGSYDAYAISMKHFSGDKRKRAHVTGSIALNATPAERDMGVTRLAWVVGREWGYGSGAVYAAGAKALCAPCMRSIW